MIRTAWGDSPAVTGGPRSGCVACRYDDVLCQYLVLPPLPLLRRAEGGVEGANPRRLIAGTPRRLPHTFLLYLSIPPSAGSLLPRQGRPGEETGENIVTSSLSTQCLFLDTLMISPVCIRRSEWSRCCGKHPAKAESPGLAAGVSPWSAGGCRVGTSPRDHSDASRARAHAEPDWIDVSMSRYATP